MTEAKKAIFLVQGLPVPGVDQLHSFAARKISKAGLVAVHKPNWSGNLQEELGILGDKVETQLGLGSEVVLVGSSAGGALAANVRRRFPESAPFRVGAAQSRLNMTDIPGYRTMEQLRGISPVAADAVAALENDGLSPAMRAQIRSLRVSSGDNLVHPDMTIFKGADNRPVPYEAANHGDAVRGIMLFHMNDLLGI